RRRRAAPPRRDAPRLARAGRARGARHVRGQGRPQVPRVPLRLRDHGPRRPAGPGREARLHGPMTAHFRIFSGYNTWETLAREATDFVTSLGPDRVISISHATQGSAFGPIIAC